MKKLLIILAAIIILSVFVLAQDKALIFKTSVSNAEEITKDSSFYVSLGNYLLEKEYEEQAIIIYRTALKFSPENEVVRNNLAVIYHEKEEYSLAIEQLRILVELNPDNPSYNYDLAINIATNYRYNQIGGLEEAITYFEKADSIEPGFEKAVENIEVLKRVIEDESFLA